MKCKYNGLSTTNNTKSVFCDICEQQMRPATTYASILYESSENRYNMSIRMCSTCIDLSAGVVAYNRFLSSIDLYNDIFENSIDIIEYMKLMVSGSAPNVANGEI